MEHRFLSKSGIRRKGERRRSYCKTEHPW